MRSIIEAVTDDQLRQWLRELEARGILVRLKTEKGEDAWINPSRLVGIA